jgi:NADPH2:quinone reductase
VPAFPPLRFINKSGFLTRPKLNDYTVTREELMSRANDIYGWLAKGEMTVTVSTIFFPYTPTLIPEAPRCR